MLYIAVGDGGKRDDVRRLAQNPFLLNGKVLRNRQITALKVLVMLFRRLYLSAKKACGAKSGQWVYVILGIDYDRKTGIFWLADTSGPS